MKTFLSKLVDNRGEIVRSALNLGGTILVVVGVAMLPIDLSYRFILLGLALLVLWRATKE